MRQLGTLSARGAAMVGNGWKASAGFSITALKESNPKAARAARLKAAIRRLQYAKEGNGSNKATRI